MTNQEEIEEGAAVEEIPETYLQYCTFRFGDELYGIEISKIQEIINMLEIFPVPTAPDYILGAINLRGNIVPIIDIKPILKQTAWKSNVNSRIILLNSDNMAVGVVVDEIGDVISLTESKIEPLELKKDDERSKYLIGISKLPDKVLAILDPKSIIDDTKL